jgi:hypothetical protein
MVIVSSQNTHMVSSQCESQKAHNQYIGQFDIEIIGLNPRLPWTMTVEGVIYHTLYDYSSYMVAGS